MANTHDNEEHPVLHNEKLDRDGKREYHGGDVQQCGILGDLDELINPSGHKDQLRRQYGLLSICGLALTVDNAWIAMGSSLIVAINNGGPPGVIYEFFVAVVYYAFIAASIAELASAIPSAGGVYHWASVTPGPKAGRILGFYTGWLNFFGWIFDLSSIVYIMAELLVQMYVVYHSDLAIQGWHIYVALICVCWSCVAITIFGSRMLPALQSFGLFMVVVGGFVTIVVVAAMPSQHASNAFVWTDWTNLTGWPDGIAFLTGVLNGAFTIGTSGAVTHMAEDISNPRRDLPKAVAAQIILGSLTAFCFLITLSYGITNLDVVTSSNGSFPLATIYSQATGSDAATFGLLFIIFLSLIPCLIGTFLSVGRIWWSLARDNAIPFSKFFSSVNETLSCPVPATLLCGVLTTAFCAMAVGSKTAFTDLAGSFVILSTTSYALAICPHVLTGRRNVPRGPFYMGSAGFFINGAAVACIVFFNIMYCLPYVYPVTTESMNYNSVILAGVVFITTIWWLAHGIRKYPGPKLADLHHRD